MALPKSYIFLIVGIVVVAGVAIGYKLLQKQQSSQSLQTSLQQVNKLINQTNQTNLLQEEQAINRNATQVVASNNTTQVVTEVDQLINETNTTAPSEINSTEVEQIFI